MSDPRMELARKRAALILQVRSGRMTATQAARILGISRKTYYQWEKRALTGMLHQLQDLPPGRPPKVQDPEKQALQQQVKELEQEVRVSQQTARTRELLRPREN